MLAKEQPQSEKADTVVEATDTNDMFDFPYSKKPIKRGSKDVRKRPKSYRAGSKSVKKDNVSRNHGNPSARNDKITNIHDDHAYKNSPGKNSDYISKVQHLIRNYSGANALAKSSSNVKLSNRALFSNNTRMTIDARTNEVKRFKPKKVRKEKEKLYEENMEFKMMMNAYKHENIKLKTQLKQLQKEQTENDAIVEEVLNQNAAPAVGRISKAPYKHKEAFLAIALKKQINELKLVVKDRDTEISELKRNYKYTRINELETDCKTYIEELIRLRTILDSVLKSKDPLSNPEQINKIEKEFNIQQSALKNVQKENKDLVEIIKVKDKEISDKDLLLKDKDQKLEKTKDVYKEIRKLKQAQREKTKELTKARNELILLKTKQTSKDKAEIDELLKSQQKQEVGAKNNIINALKNDKKKLSTRAASLSKQVENLTKEKTQQDEALKKEKTAKKYYEDLYKDEREKNVELQKQLKKTTPPEEVKEMTKKKSARPISANKHGRGRTANLDEEMNDVIDEKAELELSNKKEIEKESDKEPKLKPLTLNDVKTDFLTFKYEALMMKNKNVKSYFKSISMTSEEFVDILKKTFGINVDSATKMARYIYQKDSTTYNPQKSMLTQAVLSNLYELTELSSDSKPHINHSEVEKSLFSKLFSCKESMLETIKLDDEDSTGYNKYENIVDCIEVLELELSEEEKDHLMLIMYTKGKGINYMHYPSLQEWIEKMHDKYPDVVPKDDNYYSDEYESSEKNQPNDYQQNEEKDIEEKQDQSLSQKFSESEIKKESVRYDDGDEKEESYIPKSDKNSNKNSKSYSNHSSAEKSDKHKSHSSQNKEDQESVNHYSEQSVEENPEDNSLAEASKGVNIISEPLHDSKVESELQFRLALTKLAHAMNQDQHTVHSLFCANESTFDEEHHMIKISYFKK